MKKIEACFIFFILQFIFINGVFAQKTEEKKINISTQTNSQGLKQASKNTSEINTVKPGQNIVSEQIKKPATENSAVKSENILNSKASASWDYSKLPSDVQVKINENKSAGRELSYGIQKVYEVKISSCVNASTTQEKLSILSNQKGIIKSEFLSAGIVKIVVEPWLASVELKEKLLNEKIDFSFLKEFFLVNK